MFALVESGSITQMPNGNKGIQIGDVNTLQQSILYGVKQKETQ